MKRFVRHPERGGGRPCAGLERSKAENHGDHSNALHPGSGGEAYERPLLSGGTSRAAVLLGMSNKSIFINQLEGR